MTQFKKGDIVKLFCRNILGEIEVEGYARVIKKCDYGEHYYEIFIFGTGVIFDRDLSSSVHIGNENEKKEGEK